MARNALPPKIKHRHKVRHTSLAALPEKGGVLKKKNFQGLLESEAHLSGRKAFYPFTRTTPTDEQEEREVEGAFLWPEQAGQTHGSTVPSAIRTSKHYTTSRT